MCGHCCNGVAAMLDGVKGLAVINDDPVGGSWAVWQQGELLLQLLAGDECSDDDRGLTHSRIMLPEATMGISTSWQLCA